MVCLFLSDREFSSLFFDLKYRSVLDSTFDFSSWLSYLSDSYSSVRVLTFGSKLNSLDDYLSDPDLYYLERG